MPQIPPLLDMLKAGVHFGHQKSKWHPKMRSFIYTVRHDIHILDLEQTTRELERSLKFISSVAEQGGTVLFTSLKEQADQTLREAAVKTNMPYIVSRWLGGIFTNFGVISKLIQRLDTLEREKQQGVWEQKYSKREQLDLERDMEKLKTTVGGVRTLNRLPQAIFLIGTREAKNAIREARKVGVPVVAIVDTNTNPDLVNYPIPANDDALRSIQLITNLVAEAIIEGQKVAEERRAASPVVTQA